MKKLALLSVLFGSIAAFGQGQNTPCPANLALCGTPQKVANLASYTILKGTIAVVSDGNSASDCTNGGGSTMVTCQTNGTTWSQIAGSGGSGTVTSSGSPVSGNIAKFTTATNIAPAAASDIITLFTSCSGTQYLGADGACHTASGSSAFNAITTGTNTTATMTVGSGGSLVPSSATAGVVSANQINGTSMAGLATGILYNTTTTGVPSIATAANLNTAGICVPTNSSPTFTNAGNTTFAIGSAVCASATISTTHSQSTTLVLTSPYGSTSAHGYYDVYFVGDSTGGAVTVTLGSGCTWKVSGGGSGAIPTVNVAASEIDKLHFEYDGTNCYATYIPLFN